MHRAGPNPPLRLSLTRLCDSACHYSSDIVRELGDWLGTVITHLALLNSAYGIYGRKPRNQTGRVPAT